MICDACGGLVVDAEGGAVCVRCGKGARTATRASRRGRRRVNRTTCGHRQWSVSRVRHVNGERREVSRCLRCGEERQVEVEV